MSEDANLFQVGIYHLAKFHLDRVKRLEEIVFNNNNNNARGLHGLSWRN